MDYIVLDLEWNQGADRKEEKAKALPFEVIEIGAVRLDEKRNRKDSFHRIIQPVVYPRLYEITRQLVRLTQSDLEKGVTFAEAGKDFLEWCGKEYRFCTWGTSDLSVLQQNLDYFGVEYELEDPLFYYDIQQLYGIAFEQEQKVRNLKYAVTELKLPADRPFHGALQDAEYAAEVFARINPGLVSRYPALNLYRHPGKADQTVRVRYPEYCMTVSEKHDAREKVRQDRQMTQLYCCICGKKSKRIIPWFAEGGNTRGYYSLGQCRQHGYLKGKMMVKNPLPSEFFGIQTVRPVSEEEAERMSLRYRERQKRHK